MENEDLLNSLGANLMHMPMRDSVAYSDDGRRIVRRTFLDALTSIGDIYDTRGEYSPEQIKKRSTVYWAALCHRSLAQVLSALNAHVRDPERGRFFPRPADVEAKICDVWLSADEAWARLPKPEAESAAMTDEMAQALAVVQDMIDDGDMTAARMAFRSAYSRLIEQAKAKGSHPKWFASYGADRGQRHIADVAVVEMKNALLPPDRKDALPPPPPEPLAISHLEKARPTSGHNSEAAEEAISALKMLFGSR